MLRAIGKKPEVKVFVQGLRASPGDRAPQRVARDQMRHAQGAASGDEAPRTKIRRCLQGHCYVYAAVGLSDKGRQWLRDESSTFLVAAAVSASSVRAADDVSANLVDALTGERVRRRALAWAMPCAALRENAVP